MKRSMRVLAAAVTIALAPVAAADSAGDSIDNHVRTLDASGANRGQAQVAGKIASNFEGLAGSKENSLALVNALRNGTDATLTYKTPPVKPGGTPTTTTNTYDPPTGKMGWGNVKISLALAQDSLARAGIRNPTAEQLQAALNGGSVTVKNADGTTSTTQLKGVLQMRADGMGWGQIAKASGTQVGPVVSQLKMANTQVASIPPSPVTAKNGITTANGVSATQGAKGGASGRGVVTGAGGATTVASTSGGKPSTAGAGVVNGSGGGASGVTTGNGGNGKGNGNGNGNSNGNGKGKGG